jgi:kynurenine formamidase
MSVVVHLHTDHALDASRGSTVFGVAASAEQINGCKPESSSFTPQETYEVQPPPDSGVPATPQPVHTLLLIEHGIYIMESLDLEELARDRVYEFLFVALPLKIRGATGSWIDPVAVV